MADKQKYYAPPPRRRSGNVVRKELYRHLKGKPTHSSSLLSIPKVIGIAISRAVTLFILILVIMAFLLGGLGGGMLIGYITTASPVSTEHIKNRNEMTRIKDMNGEDVAILTGSQNINREYISFSTVKSTYIDEAFKAIEDERFDSHIGIDPRRIFSAVLSAVVNGGNATHGGSTISQQAVKLISGADQVSAQRKVQEWYNAIQLEQQKSKDEIMELYLNLVPMGNSYVGIQSAAKAYFDKEAKDLTLVECAFLAGIPNGPSIYNPLTETGRRNALRRMRIILGKMHELEMISDNEYKLALNTEVVFRKTPLAVSATQVNSYFVDYVIDKVTDDLVQKRGYSAQMASIAVYNYGLTIETTLDPAVQAQAEETFTDQTLFISDPDTLIDLPEKPNGSVVIIDNLVNPGQIKAMVGGYGEKTGNLVLNRAVDAHRQPGSSIKPLAVYGPALDTGKITAATVFTDQEYFFDDDNPEVPYPKNSYTQFKGNLSVRDALKFSSNTIAAYVWKYVLFGETSLLYLRQVGIDRSTENYVSIALGAFNKGMSALEMSGAYAAFANGGLYTEPYAYTRVLDIDGKVLLENKPFYEEVYKPETAFIMSDILKGVFTSGGTASGYGLDNMPAAGKTGTTDNNRDKWFCGYTRYYTAAVWYGYDNLLGLTTIPKDDQRNAIKIWQDVMNRIHQDKEVLDFERPDGILTMTVCPDSGQKVSPYCPVSVREYFIPGALMNPKDLCTIHEAQPTPTPQPTPVPTTVQTTQPTQNGG
jgi:penicillin-binding protein 1A